MGEQPIMDEESIEVFDTAGHGTGIAKPKSHIHRDGDWHLAVHVWIVSPDGRILLQRRASVKENHPDRWDVSFAGHVSAGEPALQAAVREGFEELGLTIEPEAMRFLATIPQQEILRGGTYHDNEIAQIYVVRQDVALEELRFQPEEVRDARWVTAEELEQMVNDGDPDLVPHPAEYGMICAVARHDPFPS